MRRRFVTLLVLSTIAHFRIGSAQTPARSATDSPTVVFVCEHGTVKSVVAMAYFTQAAREQHLPLRAVSRGTSPDPSVPSVVRTGLQADGLPLRAFVPTLFTLADLNSAVTVISFDQPSVASMVGGRLPVSPWDGLPAVSDNYGIARDAIRLRVAALVDSLAKAWKVRQITPRP